MDTQPPEAAGLAESPDGDAGDGRAPMRGDQHHAPYARARRIVLAAGTFLLAVGLVLATIPPIRNAAVALFTGPTPTPSAPPSPGELPGQPEMTETAEATSFLALERRPLRLPTVAPGTPCPRTLGQYGPVYNDYLDQTDGVFLYAAAPQYPGGWGGNKMNWFIRPPYQGPVLIRGHQIDGPHDLRFTGGLDEITQGPFSAPLLPALRFLGGPGYWAPTFSWVGNMFVQALGCYAYQVDGLTFSYSRVFEAMPLSGGGG